MSGCFTEGKKESGGWEDFPAKGTLNTDIRFGQIAIMCKSIPLQTHGIVKDGTAHSWLLQVDKVV